MPPKELFAYGTLIHGAPDAHVRDALSRHARIGPRAWVHGELLDLGPYPGALPARRRGCRIEGRIITLLRPQQLLPLLDAYEGADPERPAAGLYRREVVRARPALGPPRPVWIYWLNRVPRHAVRLPRGRWPA